MKIRSRLTILFILIVVVINIIASTAIYLSSADYREDDFYNRLENKGNNVAKLLIEVDEIDADLLRRIEADNPTSLPEESVTIFDYRNTIVFQTNDYLSDVLDSALLDEIRLNQSVRTRIGEYEVLGSLYADKYDRFVVVTSGIDIYGMNKLRNLRNILIVVFVASILLASFGGWIYSGKVLNPISNVINEVEKVSISNLHVRLEEGNRTDEIAQLAIRFNQMLDRLENSFHLQKSFIDNSSHELRTPLTSITSQLEVVLLTKKEASVYEKVLHSVLEDIKQLTDLSNKLLLLAQANSDLREKHNKLFRIDEMLWTIKEDLSRKHSTFRINIDFDSQLDESTLMLFGEDHLLRNAISNIIENSCKYSSNHTSDIFVKGIENKIELTFQDNGIGIPISEQDKIFQPFFRGTNAMGFHGHGIGLSLTKKVIELNQGTIEIKSTGETGSTIMVRLPLPILQPQ